MRIKVEKRLLAWIDIEPELFEKIKGIFEQGGHVKMQITDVQEWLDEDDEHQSVLDELYEQYGSALWLYSHTFLAKGVI